MMLVWLLHWLINYRIGVYLGSCVLWYYRQHVRFQTHNTAESSDMSTERSMQDSGLYMNTIKISSLSLFHIIIIIFWQLFIIIMWLTLTRGHINCRFYSPTTIKRWPVATPNKISNNIIVELQFNAFVSFIQLRWYQQVSVWKCLLLLLTPIN